MKDSETYDYIYNKEEMLNNICRESRIIEPTFDDINNHLEFDPEFFFYRAKSNMGENTNLMFFDKPEFIEELEKMSEVVRKAVKKYDDSYSVIQYFIELTGYEFYYNKFYEYWRNEKEYNRI